MNEFDVKRFALVLAVQAEIEGMKVRNKQKWHPHKEIMAYGEAAFKAKAEELRVITSLHNDQL